MDDGSDQPRALRRRNSNARPNGTSVIFQRREIKSRAACPDVRGLSRYAGPRGRVAIPQCFYCGAVYLLPSGPIERADAPRPAIGFGGTGMLFVRITV